MIHDETILIKDIFKMLVESNFDDEQIERFIDMYQKDYDKDDDKEKEKNKETKDPKDKKQKVN